MSPKNLASILAREDRSSTLNLPHRKNHNNVPHNTLSYQAGWQKLESKGRKTGVLADIECHVICPDPWFSPSPSDAVIGVMTK
jgi:hypothetical protein